MSYLFNITGLCVIAGCALALGGCSEYLDRRDTLRLDSGEAVQANIITHQIDPWPPHAHRLHSATSGDRLQRAVERYRTSGTDSGLPRAAAPPNRETPPPRASF